MVPLRLHGCLHGWLAVRSSEPPLLRLHRLIFVGKTTLFYVRQLRAENAAAAAERRQRDAAAPAADSSGGGERATRRRRTRRD